MFATKEPLPRAPGPVRGATGSLLPSRGGVFGGAEPDPGPAGGVFGGDAEAAGLGGVALGGYEAEFLSAPLVSGRGTALAAIDRPLAPTWWEARSLPRI